MKRLAIALFIVTLAVAGTAYAADNYLGTWKLNVAKSTYSPGQPPKSQTTKLEAAEGGLKEIVDRVNADGTTTHWELTAKYDGKDYPVKGDPDRDTVAVKRIDDNTLEVVSKKAGKVTASMKIVVSKDGNSLTNAVTGTNARGQQINNMLVFDRQ